MPLVKNWLAWSIGNGSRVLVGQDPFVGCSESYKLSEDLLQHLKSLEVYSLAHIENSSHLNI
jgi:hypothetical protein